MAGQRRYHLASLAGVAVLVGTLGLCFWGLLGPLDLLTFLHAGRAALAGRSPYSSPASPVFRAGHAFVYPSFVAWVFVPLALLPRQLAVDSYLAASVLGLVAAGRWFGRPDDRAAALLLVSAPTIIALQIGTLNPLLVVGIAACWRLRAKQPLAAGALLGVVAAMKLFLLPLLLWPLIRRRRTELAGGLGVLAVVAALQVPLGGVGLPGYASMLSRLEALEVTSSWSLTSLLESLGATPHLAGVLAPVAGGVALVGLWWRRNHLTDAQLLGLTVLASLLMSPIVWSSYLLLLAVPLLLWSRGHLPLAIAAVGSWALVTPDVASPARIAAGFGVAVLTAAIVLAGPRWRRRAGAPVRARWAAAVRSIRRVRPGVWVALAVFGGALVVVPASVRNALPAVMVVTGLGAWGIAQPAGPETQA